MMITDTLTNARLERLYRSMEQADLDAVALVPGANFYFLTSAHFHLMERPTIFLVTRAGEKHAIIPALEKARWNSLAPDVDTVYWQDADGYQAAFARIAARLPAGRIGVEGQRMRVFEYKALRQAFAASRIVDAHEAISAMRLCKDDAEIAAIRKAIDISEKALDKTLGKVAAGMSEAVIRQMLIADMLEQGADGTAFEPIVLAGAASADPHGTSSATRLLMKGDALLIDYGAAWGGYAADITRTFFCRTITPAHRDIYETVLAANEVGRMVSGPGVSLHEIDTAVGASMRDAGFGQLIAHKTGHGLGLDIHEAPQVMVGNMRTLEPGMVFTIEPGLYREGDVGVRIEDDVVVTTGGADSLTAFDRNLMLIG